jgi:DNA-binding response OmpR family regulator
MLDHASSTRASDKYPTLCGKRILVVEDDALIAVDYHFQLKEVGAQPKAYEPTSKAALEYLATHDIDAAIVDYCLRDGTCEQVLKFLRSRDIPFVIVTGCEFEMRGNNLNSPHVLSKPTTPADIWRALSDILH